MLRFPNGAAAHTRRYLVVVNASGEKTAGLRTNIEAPTFLVAACGLLMLPLSDCPKFKLAGENLTACKTPIPVIGID